MTWMKCDPSIYAVILLNWSIRMWLILGFWNRWHCVLAHRNWWNQTRSNQISPVKGKQTHQTLRLPTFSREVCHSSLCILCPSNSPWREWRWEALAPPCRSRVASQPLHCDLNWGKSFSMFLIQNAISVNCLNHSQQTIDAHTEIKKTLATSATLSQESSATTPAMECNFRFWPGSKLIFTTFRPSLEYFFWAEQVLGR